ncbi:MAG TPA: SRPBCC domain-containing protein, partial [Actinotalea sp.]|nr:SRPBCC domain-containing protein [Actinotalea sp.]
EVVFDVVSNPEHVTHWWPDEARYSPTPGAEGEIVFHQRGAEDHVVPFSVVEAHPPRLFSFRWTHAAGDAAAEGNSLLVTFELIPVGAETLLRMTETGFREMGWQAAVLEHTYHEHVTGWDYFLPRLAPYATTLAARR